MKSIVWLSALLVILWSSCALGTQIDFGDNNFYWPSWNNGQFLDNRDQIEAPNFTGGYVNISTSGYITQIAFHYDAFRNSILTPGDLFIDSQADGYWDYVVKLDFNKDAGNYSLYRFTKPFSINKGVNDSWYMMSGQDNIGDWRGLDIRDNHPVGINVDVTHGGIPSDAYSIIGTTHFSGWPGSGWSYFDFGLPLFADSNELYIAWTVSCANDVLFEKIPVPPNPPVPEPATMFLLGSGLIGLAAAGRKKFRNQATRLNVRK